MNDWLKHNIGSKWQGKGELWCDPAGNTAQHYECKLSIEPDLVAYSWRHEGKEKKGSFTLNETGARWQDNWHQNNPVQCVADANAWGIFTFWHEYEVPDNPNWAWRSKLSERPDSSLVLQMTNITPWGEEGRAVRMVFQRA